MNKLANQVLDLPRIAKRVLVVAVDAILCIVTVWLAFYLRLDEWVSFELDGYWRPDIAAAVSVAVAIPIFVLNGFYRAIFRYSGWPAMNTIAVGIGIYAFIFITIFSVIGIAGVPRTVGLIQPILLLLLVGSSRLAARYWLGGLYQNILFKAQLPKVLIYGAGSTGRQLASALANSRDMRVVGFLDDNNNLHGQTLNGLSIYSPSNLPAVVAKLKVNTILLAFSSASRRRRNEILTLIKHKGVAVRTLPKVAEIASGKVKISDLRELDIDDLLGRDPVQPNSLLMSQNNTGKTVMITGAGGSIGSELARQITLLSPKTLLLVEQNEYALYNIFHELEETLKALKPNNKISLIPLLGNVRDESRMGSIFRVWRPNTVYHAAAYKHVPLVEHNSIEGLQNNLFGTITTSRLAEQFGVQNFVLISTDKAVRPTNVMGATKRLAEMALQALAANECKTVFSMVRFGNVLGSSGSVVPKFRQQIKDGGPITLTDPEMTRYFMTIPEAAQLVIQAGAMANGGDVFLLDMGEPVKIYELAKRMIELSGLEIQNEQNPDGDIEIQITGLRPGEKLYEELLIGENPLATEHPRIMKGQENFIPLDQFEVELEKLRVALDDNDLPRLRSLLIDLVDGYVPEKIQFDWVQDDFPGKDFVR